MRNKARDADGEMSEERVEKKMTSIKGLTMIALSVLRWRLKKKVD